MAKSDVKAPAKEKEAKAAPVLGKAEITIAEKLVELRSRTAKRRSRSTKASRPKCATTASTIR
jgi:hypothetical protein